MRPDRTFPSRIDPWLVAVVGSAALLPLAAAAWLAARGTSEGVVVLAICGLVISAVVVACGVPVRYECRAAGLHIRSGWMRWQVPYASLSAVAPSRNPLSAPAWSLRRVRLDLAGGDLILVSPDDRESFIDEIAARCPHLTRTPSGLVARPSAP